MKGFWKWLWRFNLAYRTTKMIAADLEKAERAKKQRAAKRADQTDPHVRAEIMTKQLIANGYPVEQAANMACKMIYGYAD